MHLETFTAKALSIVLVFAVLSLTWAHAEQAATCSTPHEFETDALESEDGSWLSLLQVQLKYQRRVASSQQISQSQNQDAARIRTELSKKLTPEQILARSGVKQPVWCDAASSCNSSCVATVSNGGAGTQFQMKVFPNDQYISWLPLCQHETWEWDLVQQLMMSIQSTKRGSVLDIGANLGSWTLPIAAEKRKVIAVEASPLISSALQESISMNNFQDTVTVENFAVVKEISSTKVVCMGSTDAALQNASNAGANQVNVGDRNFCAQEVPAKTVDQFYEDQVLAWQEIVAVKLDCEGCEGEALFGAKKFLSTHPPCILAMEVTEKWLCETGTPISELKDFLDGFNFDTGRISSIADGTCEGYGEWEQLPENKGVIPQYFAFVPQKNIEACLARFL